MISESFSFNAIVKLKIMVKFATQRGQQRKKYVAVTPIER